MYSMHVKPLVVIETTPAVTSQTLAVMALCKLRGKSFHPMGVERVQISDIMNRT